MRRRWGFTFLRTGAVFALLLSTTAGGTARDYSPWVERPSPGTGSLIELAQRPNACCKHCTKGQPCGNTCISAKAKCKSAPGCAC